MSNNNNILKLFHQPVFKYQIDNFKKINEELTKYIYELNKKDNIGVNKSNINGWHSRAFDFNEKENIPNKFYSHINSYIEDVFSKLGWEHDKTKVKCTSMWAIINKKGNFNIEHTHPNNYLSAAYYVKAPENCGSFIVTNPNSVARERIPVSDNKTQFNQNIVHIKPEEGDLLLFPAYLPHSVGMNLSDKDRIVISFNIDILK